MSRAERTDLRRPTGPGRVCQCDLTPSGAKCACSDTGETWSRPLTALDLAPDDQLAITTLTAAAGDARTRRDHAEAARLVAERDRLVTTKLDQLRAGLAAEAGKGETTMDAELRNLAREINVPRYDDFNDERELALAVLKHCGVNVRRPYVSTGRIAVQDEHDVYVREVAKNAVKIYLRYGRDRMDGLGVRTDGARGERFDDPRTDADRRLDARTVADAKRRAHLQSLHVAAEYQGEHEQALYRRHIEQAVAEQGRRGHVDSPRGSSSRDRAYAAYAEHNRNAWRRPTEDSTDE